MCCFCWDRDLFVGAHKSYFHGLVGVSVGRQQRCLKQVFVKIIVVCAAMERFWRPTNLNIGRCRLVDLINGCIAVIWEFGLISRDRWPDHEAPQRAGHVGAGQNEPLFYQWLPDTLRMFFTHELSGC
jgi:hypothetical protein